MSAQLDMERDFGQLFIDVQMGRVFPDSKTFPDCVPTAKPAKILKSYLKQSKKKDFELKEFVYANFSVPGENPYQAAEKKAIGPHINQLWGVLARNPDARDGNSTLLPLPKNYIVPGGRFREVYYWDTYFTMLGLQVSRRLDLMKSVTDNFSHLIDTYGFVPNGNRSYYLSRSQPPFFTLMVGLLAEEHGKGVYREYLPQIEKEHAFWMDGAAGLAPGKSFKRVVAMPGGETLNRYWDDRPAPRTESYHEDVALAESSGRPAEALFRDLRAACESGWDFSSRWLTDGQDLATINTTAIVPVDLNALLYHIEKTLAEVYRDLEQGTEKSAHYATLAEKRKAAVLKYCWDDKAGFFTDYLLDEGRPSPRLSMAGAYPLFFMMVQPEQAKTVAIKLNDDFLKPGGFVSSLADTGQQWDAPNGWPPLQWMAIQGLENYGHRGLAAKAAAHWIANCKRVYENTGKMVEKYNVSDLNLAAGGGEYPLQDGFGWSNGVLLRLMANYPQGD